ncbi:hypothetical protein AB6A40_002048 [Gnathostoma spinigerum]|uniref:C2 domain-containing protein n=1 Tax=Gnathostoma spinigerum TaxID=75299 RepID=A0ABD6EB26_9BILA
MNLLFIFVFLEVPALIFCANEYWITVDLQSVEWRPGCLTTAGCADPRFQLSESNTHSEEKVSISWIITRDIVQDAARSFVTHWTESSPNDLKIGCEVIGIDPTYGFPRICDSTITVRPFERNQIAETHELSRSQRHQQLPDLSAKESEKMLVEMKGRCFNATLIVMKHEDRCPWCIEPEQITVIEQQYSSADRSIHFLGDLTRGDQLLYIGVIILTIVAVFCSGAFACILVAFLRAKRCNTMLKSEQSCFGVYGGHGHRIQMDSSHSSEDSRYETPWEQKYRPIPRWSGGRSNDVRISSPNTISDTLSNQTSKTTLGGTQRLNSSPNTSMSDNHDDSGLDV